MTLMHEIQNLNHYCNGAIHLRDVDVIAKVCAFADKLEGEEMVERIARTIHEAKIKSCWPKAMQAGREPWDKANSAIPDQPWHDIARDEAKAALAVMRGMVG